MMIIIIIIIIITIIIIMNNAYVYRYNPSSVGKQMNT